MIKLVLIWLLIMLYPVLNQFNNITSDKINGRVMLPIEAAFYAALVYLIMLAVYWVVGKASHNNIGRYVLRVAGLVPLLLPFYYVAINDPVSLGVSTSLAMVGAIFGAIIALLVKSQLNLPQDAEELCGWSAKIDNLKTISRTDAIIMVFPLFSYGIPGALMRLLEDFYLYAKENGYNKAGGLYIVVNCGFPRPEIMGELIRVIKNFCRRLSLNWRFAICMGGGPIAAMTVKAPLLNMKYKRAFLAISADIKNGDTGQKDNYFIKPLIPEPVMLWIKAQYEKKMRTRAASKFT